MPEISKNTEVNDFIKPEISVYKKIKPEQNTSFQEAKEYWDNFFESDEEDAPERDLEQTLDDYFQDLNDKSDCPDTLSDRPFEVSDLNKLSPEENARMREEFDDKRTDLKREWEEVHGRPWPKYEEDVYSSNGKLIRKAGSDYDAHHIQPLGMGGKNEVSNITPLHAEVHYDKQGIHAPDSPYSKLDQKLGGME